MHNLVTVFHTVCMLVGGSKIFGDAEAPLFVMVAWLTTRNTPLPHVLLYQIWSL